jgi:3-oxoacyl-[acyl-carrier protein] reductase
LKLQGRSALITGASEGLGRAIAERFVDEGASVLLCARNEAALAKTQEDLLRHRKDSSQKIAIRHADVGQEPDVDALFVEADRTLGNFDILVTNAGVYGPMGLFEDNDWAAWVEAVRINLFGTAYPCRHAMMRFRRRRYGKIINISGGGATAPLPRLSSYAASKAAVVRLSETLALEGKEFNIDVNAVAPGALATRMTRQLLEAGAETVGRAFHERMTKIAVSGGTPLEFGANLCVYLGSAESDGITGRLLSAQWDPWERLQSHRADLEATDIYTLRRIVPAERGKTWGER